MDRHAAANRSDRFSGIILFITIAGAPLPFGSRDLTTIAFWCFLLGFGLLFASTRQLRRGHFLLLGGISFIVACYGFVLHEQLAAHPWIATPNPIWAKTSELLGHPVVPSVSIVRGEPFYALGPPLSCLLALTLGLVVGADGNRARQAMLVMGWSGVGYAIYGIVNLLFDPTAILWHEREIFTRGLAATFINRNTAAAYFGSCAVVWVVLFMAAVRGRLPAGPIVWKKLGANIISGVPEEKQIIIRFSAFFVCLAAMFMTASRSGVLLSLFAMVITFVIFFRRDLPRGISLLLAALSAGAVALALLVFLGGNVEDRIDVGGLVDQGRLAAYHSTLRIIAHYPWFGTGLGTFPSIFPAYRSANVSILGVWDLAHSTPLELAAELGIPLTVAVVVGWIVIFFVLMQGTRRSRRETVVPLAALAASLIAVLHTSIDFSLQVTGYAIVIFSLVGVGLAESFNIGPSNGDRRRSTRSKGHAEEISRTEGAFAARSNSASRNVGRSEAAQSAGLSHRGSGFLPPT